MQYGDARSVEILMPISLVRDNPLTVQVGATATISAASNLAVSDTDYPDSSIAYTITTAPTRGTLLKNGSPTSSFTQDDLDNNRISYREDQPSNAAVSDGFFFRASDPSNNQTATTFFQINITPLTPPPTTILNAPGSLTTYANLSVGHLALGIFDNSGDNFRLDIATVVGEVTVGNLPASKGVSQTGSAATINSALSTEYRSAVAGPDTITLTLTDLTTNASITKTINVTVRLANFADVAITPAYGINNAGQIVGPGGYGPPNFSGNTLTKNINDSGETVGSYFGFVLPPGLHQLPSAVFGGFLNSNGNVTTTEHAFLEGINNLDQVAGYVQLPVGPPVPDQAFIYQSGTFQNIGPAGTAAFGNNDPGQVVGVFNPQLAAGEKIPPSIPTDGFLYSNGVFSLFDDPYATSTTPRDINNAGLIVGYFQNGSGTHGFAYNPTTGQWWTIDVPGATSTLVYGINDVNQIVGSYTDAINVTHSFVGTLPPPLPAAPGNVEEWILSNGKWEVSAGPGSHPAGSHVAAVADFTGDRTSDILWQNLTTGALDLWKIVFGGWVGGIDLGTHPGLGSQIAGGGDFNQDGTNDVLWFNPSNGQTDIWQLSNGNWAASVSPGPHPIGYQVAGIGDFNRDGTSDILWFNAATGDVDEWNIVNGHWAGSNSIGAHPGSGWQIGGVGDFNNDGTSDVLWYNASSGAADIWLLANGKWAASVSPGNHPTGYQIAGIGDFNHDGTNDALFYNPATGNTDEWMIANARWGGSVDLGAHSGIGWSIGGIGDFDGSLTSDVLWHQFV
jgi:hypothetical protein